MQSAVISRVISSEFDYIWFNVGPMGGLYGLDITFTTLMRSLTTSYAASQQVDWPSCNYTGFT